MFKMHKNVFLHPKLPKGICIISQSEKAVTIKYAN